uniref:NADPH--cytochrome P450 reductase n=1 Tax=Cryptocotyle lingua TaxID=66766 RepID=A0A7U0TIC7_9TREM|nr:NADPH--cytochrome P450 reductase [Cryptocotyle lingua]
MFTELHQDPIAHVIMKMFSLWMINLSFVDLFCFFLAVLSLSVFWFKRRIQRESMKFSTRTETLPNSVLKSITEEMLQGDIHVALFYGSQTGTAEKFAVDLHSFLFGQGIRSLLRNVEACDTTELCKLASMRNSLAVFILATHGEGEPTDSARSFVDSLSQATTRLSGLQFAVFGLGNSAYPQFNACAVLVNRLLRRRGGIRSVELGLGDELDNMEGTFLNWQTSLLEAITQKSLAYSQKVPSSNSPMRRMYKSVPISSRHSKLFVGEPLTVGSYERQIPPFTAKNPFLAHVLVNRELHTSGPRSCRHIELDTSGADFHYKPGDHVAVLPRNPECLVLKLSNLLDVNLNELINLECIDEQNPRQTPFPCPCTYHTALTHYVDLSGPPRLQLLTALSVYATDPEDARQLRYLGSNTLEGNKYYSQWILEERRNVVDIFMEFPSIRIPADCLLELLPRIKPRFYSISSSPLRDSTSLHLTVAVVSEQTRRGRKFNGLTTKWLADLIPEKCTDDASILVPIYLETSSFHLPRSCNIPVIMVAAGTGLAPFRSFIRERIEQVRITGSKSASMLLFYGCRHKAEDFLYAEELLSASKIGLLQLHLAFSRDSLNKVYVQDRMLEVAGEIWHLMDACNAHLYICGSAKTMYRDVNKCLLTLIETEGRKSKDQAEFYLKRLRADGRYHVDVWG